jgi:hypothetical protein
LLQIDREQGYGVLKSGSLEVEIDLATHEPRALRGPGAHTQSLAEIGMNRYHVLRTLLCGVTDARRVHWVNGGSR